MAPNYSVNLLGGYDYWTSIMNNPYYQIAWQTPNVNFKGNSADSKIKVSDNSTKTASTTEVNGGIPVTTTSNQTTQKTGMSGAEAGLLAGGTILAVGGAYWAIKNGKFGAAGKAIKSVFSSGESTSATVDGVLKKLTAVKGKDSKISFLIPGRTKTMQASSALEFVEKHGIPEALSLQRQQFVPGTSKLTEFICTSGDEIFVVKLENGLISGIKDKDGKEILKRLKEAQSGTPDALIFDGLENITKELGKEAKNIDENVLSGVSSIRYSNTFGDDVLEMSLPKYRDNPLLRKYTTLERFEFESPEMQGLKLNPGEEVFANAKFFKDGKLVEGLKVERFSDEIGHGCIGNFEGETLVSITKPDGTVLPAGSAGYRNIVDENQKQIEKLIKRVFEKREYIPNGATITTV